MRLQRSRLAVFGALRDEDGAGAEQDREKAAHLAVGEDIVDCPCPQIGAVRTAVVGRIDIGEGRHPHADDVHQQDAEHGKAADGIDGLVSCVVRNVLRHAHPPVVARRCWSTKDVSTSRRLRCSAKKRKPGARPGLSTPVRTGWLCEQSSLHSDLIFGRQSVLRLNRLWLHAYGEAPVLYPAECLPCGTSLFPGCTSRSRISPSRSGPCRSAASALRSEKIVRPTQAQVNAEIAAPTTYVRAV